VFQRTPSSIDVRNNRPTDPEWQKSLQPGWQQARMDNFNTLVSGGFAEEDLVNDGWTDIIGNLLVMARKGAMGRSPEEMAKIVQLADFQKMNSIRDRVSSIVKDAEKAEALKPWYNQFCKRPCFHDEYLDTFNRPNVRLVDTQGKGVDRITGHSIIANGEEFEVDCLIYATGFEVGTSYTRRAGFEIYGRDGQTLTDKWKDGVSTLHGMHSRGFPNCFIVGNSQAGFTANYPHMLNEQSKHLAYITKQAIDRQARVVEVTEQAEENWVQEVIKAAVFNRRYLEECTPGYYNNEGQPSDRAIRNGSYGAGSIAFIKLLEDWRAKGDLPGLELQ